MSNIVNKAFLDAAERKLTFVGVQDVEPYLEHAKKLRAMEQKSDAWRHTGMIPNIILTKWLHEELDRGHKGLRIGSKEFDQIIWRKLQDPDWAYLRTDGVRHKVGYGDS
jgi:hypothetical protein